MSEDTSSEEIVQIKHVESTIEELMDSNGPIELNTRHRTIIFIIMAIEYCFSSADGGIVPQQTKNIKYNFGDPGESRYGLFASFDYVGRIVGALVMTLLIDRINRQVFFCGCCIFKSITLFVATCTENYYLNLIARFLSGVPQTLLTAYGTIWTDQFGRKKRRSLMLALLQLFALLGILVGYGLGLISDAIFPIPEKVKNYGEPDDPYKDQHEYFYLGWRLAFSIEGVILAILGVIFFFCPKIFFSSTFYLNDDNDKEGPDNIGREKSLKEIKEEKETKQKEGISDFKLFIKQLPKILCTKLFILMSVGNTVAFFGMRVIQFYADIYMEVVLGIEKNIKFILFVVLCITGPISGIVIVGLIMQKIGGYGSRNGMIFIIVLNSLATLVAMLFPLTLNAVLSLASAWIYLFCLAAVTPLQGGVIIASLPKDLRGNGYSINMFLLNGIGSFPSSYVFSLICDYIADNHDSSDMRYRTTMRIVMLYNFFGLFLIILAGIIRFRIKGDLGDDPKEKDKLEGEEKDNEENNEKDAGDNNGENKEDIKEDNNGEKKDQLLAEE